ncbi:hypothetical protein GCM10025298_19600 [Natronobiforma cellulositropha]
MAVLALLCSLVVVATVAVAFAPPGGGGDDRPAASASEALERVTHPSASPLGDLTAGSDPRADGRCLGGPTPEARAVTESADGPRVTELYPNPTTYGNVGEFFAVYVPEPTSLANWSVTDGHTTASFPNRTVSGHVAFSMAPDVTAEMTPHPVVALEGHLRLAADGDELTIRDGNRTIDRVGYGRAAVGDVWFREVYDDGGPTSGDGGVWWSHGATCFPVTAVGETDVTAFALPDAPDLVRSELHAAEDRILLGGYTFTSESVADELESAAARGVTVDVLLEAGPVGGTSERTADLLDAVDENVTVRVLGGPGARYRYHHPKYAVVDDRALVTTENWNPSGVGGTSSRGWGVVVDDSAVAAHLAHVFRADFEGRDTTTWERHRANATFVEDDPPGDPYPADIDPEPFSADAVETLLAPDNAEERLLEHIRDADESIRIKQVRIGSRDLPLLEETLEAARRGVDVRILLDATWYVEDENRALAHDLERTADEEGLPLEVRLVDPRGRFEKIHAKGVVIDERVAVVGSINWNENSLRNNREVALVLHGEDVGAFYAAVFDADWEERSWPLPAELVGVVVLGLALVGLGARAYLEFEDERGEFSGSGGSWTSADLGVGPFEPPAADSTERDFHPLEDSPPAGPSPSQPSPDGTPPRPVADQVVPSETDRAALSRPVTGHADPPDEPPAPPAEANAEPVAEPLEGPAAGGEDGRNEDAAGALEDVTAERPGTDPSVRNDHGESRTLAERLEARADGTVREGDEE